MKENKAVLDSEFLEPQQYPNVNFRVISFLVGFAILGILFKKMHWPFANVILSIGLASMAGYLVSRIIWIKENNIILLLVIIAIALIVGLFIYFGVHTFSLIYIPTVTVVAFLISWISAKMIRNRG